MMQADAPQPHPPALAGRQAELAILTEQVRLARQGACRVVLLAGEPGIGKTSLLNALAGQAQQEGVLVRRGGASDAEGMPPYLPWLEALGQHIRATPPEMLEAQLDARAPVLATLLPELGLRLPTLPPMYPLPPEQARLRLYEAVAAFLATIAQSPGLLLLLDDLHWADRASFDLLHYVVQHQTQARLLVVGAYRPGDAEANPALQRSLVELNRLRILTTLSLAPLAAPAVLTLAAHYLNAPLDVATGQMLVEQSEGNPFFAEELLRDWRDSGVLTWSGTRWQRDPGVDIPIPQSIAAVVRQRLARLSVEVVALLQIAAIGGRQIDLLLVAHVAEQEPLAVEAHMQTAARFDLLRTLPDGGFSFSHDSIRACLVEDTPLLRRRELHARFGMALEARRHHPDARQLAELAFHLLQSGDRARAISSAQQAAEAALQVSAAAEAVAQYRTALNLLSPGEACYGAFLAALAAAALLANLPDDAVAAGEKAQDWFLQQGDVLAAARAADVQGRAWWQQEAIAPARAAFETALDLLAGQPAAETVQVLVSLSSLMTLSALQRDAGLEYARQAVALAQQLEDPRLIARARRALGNAQVRAANLATGIMLLEQARVLAIANDDPAEAAECCAGLRMACGWHGEHRRAVAYAHQEIALARRCQTPYALRHVYTQLVVLTTVSDGAAAGLRMLDQARACCAGLAAPEAHAYLELVEAMYWGLLQGDYVRGEQLARSAIATWRHLNPRILGYYLGVFTMLLALSGKQDEVVQSLDELEALVNDLPTESLPGGQALSWVAAVGLVLGDQPRLIRVYPRLARFRGCLMTGGLIDRLLGEIDLRRGDLTNARQLLESAEAVARREGQRWELARVLVAQADLALAGAPAPGNELARQLLREAQVHYRHVGNPVAAETLESRLNRLEQHSLQPGGLSRRELDVLRGVAAGKSNRAIAEELALSPRTVENHLANIYAKIGVDNRAAAVAFALRHNLA